MFTENEDKKMVGDSCALEAVKQRLLQIYQTKCAPGPLNGVLVIGFCYYVAGPVALQGFVDHGALAIKIEGPAGDPSRVVFKGGVFNSLTHGQLSLVIDRKDEKHVNMLKMLLSIADVVLDNRSYAAQERDVILQAHLKHFSSLSFGQSQAYCAIDGFPGSAINQPGLDSVAQAATGLAYTNCSEPGKPLKVGVAVLDEVTGLQAVNQVVATLYAFKTMVDQGQNRLALIRVSLVGTSIWLQSGQVAKALEGKEFFREGNKDPFAAPFSYYTAKNGLVAVATVNEDQFERFCLQVLKDPDFYRQYSTLQERLRSQNLFEEQLNKKMKVHDKEYWVVLCEEHAIPVSSVLTMTEAIKQDFVKESLLVKSKDGVPVVLSGARNSLFPCGDFQFEPAPSLGQDNDAVEGVLRSKL